jgi:hypothetical protein
MEGFLAFDSGFSLLTPDREIPPSVRLQLINSHSLDCTSVPWESLTLMVICWVCYILFMCVCVGASYMTTASDDPFT